MRSNWKGMGWVQEDQVEGTRLFLGAALGALSKNGAQ